MLHRALPWNRGRICLLVASYIFYGAGHWWYCSLLFLSTGVDFFLAQGIQKARTPGAKKLLLFVSVLFSVALLGSFKYGDFFIQNLNIFLVRAGLEPLEKLNWILPPGISFYTFQTLAYVIDVYRGKIPAQRDFVSFGLYLAFFPQLVAGPIERPGDLMPQLEKKRPTTLADWEYGFERILWGYVKKLVISDHFAALANLVWADPSNASGTLVLIAVVSFSFQMYLDFSAYADIAIGTARLMGIRITENFRWPFLARNPSEVWSRWHITLTTWLRDYLYAPLGGLTRASAPRAMFNILFVMTLMGFWHGANWNFILFGFVSGACVAVHQTLRVFTPRKDKGPLLGSGPFGTITGRFLVFWYLVLITAIFRSSEPRSGFLMLKKIIFFSWDWRPDYIFYLVMIAGFLFAQYFRGLTKPDRVPLPMPAPVRAVFWFLMLAVIVYGSVDQTQQFIYYRF
jgi:D-alanyl-lipoteichoic acid acyltransferase DltB (MBOAT superfamily)